MGRKHFGDIDGLWLGHAQNLEGPTGVSVVLCPEGASAGVDVRGGAPGTRETDLLDPSNLVERVHAVFLAGGSAFGLDAAAGIMAYLEEHGVGFDVGVTRVPIVCGAVLFDLLLGDPRIRPDKDMGYKACEAATQGEGPQGSVGAGAGATIGKIRGMDRALKSGIGSWACQVGELQVGALVAVNGLGDVVDPASGCRVGGLRGPDGASWEDTEEVMIASGVHTGNLFGGNTTIGVVATNARFSKAQARKLASMAHDGYARTLRPASAMVDGDTIFALATGRVAADLSTVGVLAARAVAQAVVSAVRSATSLAGVPAARDLPWAEGPLPSSPR
mgnify:CR=1 FL=1